MARRYNDPNAWRDVNAPAWRKHLLENGICPECHTELRKIEGGYACDSCMKANRWPSLFHDEEFMQEAESWLKRKASQ